MIGLATSSDFPELSGGEKLLHDALSKRGECKIVVWDDPAEAWRECESIIVRCTWDYSYRVLEFWTWIDRVEAAGITLYNSPNVLRWNSDKRYLRDLEMRGVKVVETTWIPRAKMTVESMRELVRGPSVIKPVISAGAYDTLRVSPENAEEVAASLLELNQSKGFMLQPFVEDVQSPGEYSLIYFDKEFSHAVLKTPQAGDFRVQPRYGGEQGAAQVEAEIIAQGRKILDAVPYDDRLLYARVDGVIRGGEFLLMELELIEPYLFLEFGKNAGAKLASLL